MRPTLIAALLLILTAAVYLPTLRYPFVYEDVQDMGRFERSTFSEWRAVAYDGTFTRGAVNPMRLLSSLSFDLARMVSGLEPWGDHLLSVSLHLVNCVLVLALAWLVLPPSGAVLTMGLFALHPIQVEAVAYVSARADLLATFGVLLALLATSYGSLAMAVCGVCIACLSKESAVMAWGLVPVWAIVTRAPFPVRTFALIGWIGLLAVIMVFAARVAGEVPSIDLAHIGVTAWSVCRLLVLLVVPVGFTMDHHWQVGLVAQSLAVGLMVSLTAGTVYMLGQDRLSWFALAWAMTLIWCLPRFLMPTLEGMHEHHVYVLTCFWALAVGARGSSIRLDTVRSAA